MFEVSFLPPYRSWKVPLHQTATCEQFL